MNLFSFNITFVSGSTASIVIGTVSINNFFI